MSKKLVSTAFSIQQESAERLKTISYRLSAEQNKRVSVSSLVDTAISRYLKHLEKRQG